MSITPAFSPGPWITQDALVGSPLRWMREDLYEQCSFHIAEKMPSSVKVGTRPISFRMRSYSSGLSPWAATSSGVIFGSLVCMGPLIGRSEGPEKGFCGPFSRRPELCKRGACDIPHDPEKWAPAFRKDHAQISRLHNVCGSDLGARTRP